MVVTTGVDGGNSGASRACNVAVTQLAHGAVLVGLVKSIGAWFHDRLGFGIRFLHLIDLSRLEPSAIHQQCFGRAIDYERS